MAGRLLGSPCGSITKLAGPTKHHPLRSRDWRSKSWRSYPDSMRILRRANPRAGWSKVREVLHAQFQETLTHDDVAKLVGVHPVHLATVFRRHFGCTIGEYVRRLRIEFASRRIAASDDSLCDVGLAAGFSDQSHFSKVFKQQTGMTPGQFRANLRAP